MGEARFQIRPMTLADYDAVLALWSHTEGMCIRDADSREKIGVFLARNPGMSFVAVAEGRVIGAALGGHDGRRGFLHHVAVGRADRRGGIGKTLVDACREKMRAAGIDKCHLLVRTDNTEAVKFWEGMGWSVRRDVVFMSAAWSGKPNA